MSITPTFKVDGAELIQYILSGGIRWSRNDLDSDDAGRTLDGVMHRSRVAIKRKLSVSMCRLTQAQIAAVSAAIEPEFVEVQFIDPRLGLITKTFYGSSLEAATQRYHNGEVYWEGTAFSLIER